MASSYSRAAAYKISVGFGSISGMTEEQRYWLERDFVLELLKRLPAHIFWKNKEGIYLGCNDAFADALGLPSTEEIIGKSDYDLPVKREDSDAYRRDDKQVMESREAKLNIEEEQTFPGGRRLCLLTSKVPLLDKNNEVIGVLGIYYDITELKKTQEALRLAKNEAEAASRSKSEFLANMSHDIRTPLTGIIGMAEELEAAELPVEKRKEYARQLATAGHLLLKLLNEIIYASKIEQANALKTKTAIFDLRQLLQTVIDLLKPSMQKKRLAFTMDCDDKIPRFVESYDILIHRVLLNLMSNSIKFTEKGEVRLIVKLLDFQGQNATLQLQVKDTGIGIGKERQSEIFSSFKRLMPSYESQYEGAGLGLYIVKQFVEQMQGTIQVESEKNKGTLFTCMIPVKIPSTGARERFVAVDKKLSVVTPHDGKSQKKIGKVLLVEDDSLVAKVTLLKLEKIHQQVDHLDNGKTALHHMQQVPYDLIYLDVGLPGLSGYEVAKDFRLWEKNHHKTPTPLIALTAHADDKHKQLCLLSGMDLIVHKPLNTEMAEEISAVYIGHEVGSIENKAPSALGAESTIDIEAATKLTGSKQTAMDILAMFSAELGVMRKDILDAYKKLDWEQLLMAAHKLHGATCYTGTPRLRLAASELEKYISENKNKDNITPYYARLLKEINDFIISYDKLVK